jgi:3-isopropylmalate/(R)-2-methylmalate dehydratase small subunit
VEQLMDYCSNEANPVLSVDLPNQQVKFAESNVAFSFDLDEFRKHCLLEGLDDIAMTLENESDISSFEGKHRGSCPWLF